MNKSLLLALALCGWLAACAPNATSVVAIPSPTVAVPTQPDPTETSAAAVLRCPVGPLMDAWNTGDIAAIRQFYALDGRYFSESALRMMQTQQPFDASFGSPEFVTAVQDHEGMDLRMLGKPLVVADKLVALTYSWESAGAEFTSAALLRCEGGHVLLHVAIDSNMTASSDPDMLARQMQAWTDRDVEAAHALYAPDAVVLADEDLLEASWRDFPEPPSLQMLLDHFYGWNPVVNGEPIVAQDLIVFGWGWSRFESPIGQGVRLIKLASDRIAIDIRFAIRPWEAKGREFLPGS